MLHRSRRKSLQCRREYNKHNEPRGRETTKGRQAMPWFMIDGTCPLMRQVSRGKTAGDQKPVTKRETVSLRGTAGRVEGGAHSRYSQMDREVYLWERTSSVSM